MLPLMHFLNAAYPFVVSLSALLFFVYTIYLAVFLISDERDTTSTYAWLLILFFVPVAGVILYILFGRYKSSIEPINSDSKKYIKKILQSPYTEIDEVNEKSFVEFGNDKDAPLQQKIANLALRNSRAILTSHNKIELLQTGKEKFKRLKEDLENAKQYIHLEYFIWKDDVLTKELVDTLARKSAEGVEVRLLVDAVGSFRLWLSPLYYKTLRGLGIQIYTYFSFLTPFKMHNINYRNHRKIIIIDGKIGYTGGMNMAQEYIDGGDNFNQWRDTHVRIEGKAVNVLQLIFSSAWFNTVHEELGNEYFHPEAYPEDGKMFAQIITSGPDSKWEAIKQLYFMMIISARKNVYIQSPYFIPDESIIDAMCSAALSGVDVKLMITGVPDKLLPWWAAHGYFKPLLKAGVKIYLYNKGFMHSKTISVDGTVSAVGTPNMDIRSFRINYEMCCLTYDNDFSLELESDFRKDLDHCDRYTLKSDKKLGHVVRFRNSLAKLFSPIM